MDHSPRTGHGKAEPFSRMFHEHPENEKRLARRYPFAVSEGGIGRCSTTWSTSPKAQASSAVM
jgi:hypothetical protein